jgi:cell division protein FtsL
MAIIRARLILIRLPTGKESFMRLKRAGIITKLVIFALIVYASVTLINLRAQIDAARSQQLALQEKVTEKETSNAELQYEIEHSEDKDVIAGVARDDLNLVEPGEKVFIDTGN